MWLYPSWLSSESQDPFYSKEPEGCLWSFISLCRFQPQRYWSRPSVERVSWFIRHPLSSSRASNGFTCHIGKEWNETKWSSHRPSNQNNNRCKEQEGCYIPITPECWVSHSIKPTQQNMALYKPSMDCTLCNRTLIPRSQRVLVISWCACLFLPDDGPMWARSIWIPISPCWILSPLPLTRGHRIQSVTTTRNLEQSVSLHFIWQRMPDSVFCGGPGSDHYNMFPRPPFQYCNQLQADIISQRQHPHPTLDHSPCLYISLLARRCIEQ